jgi:hypothetical protein
VAVPDVVEGQDADEDVLTNSGRARMLGITEMGGVGCRPNAFDGCTENDTLAAAVPALSIGRVNPLVVSAT